MFRKIQLGQESVINQIEEFYPREMINVFSTLCGYLYEYELLRSTLMTLKAIRNNSGFEPFEAKIFQGQQLPIKNDL